MKYGDTLQQRSVPEWYFHNVDYNRIKQVIKDNTTTGSGKAISIPGQEQEVENDFEQKLLKLLVEEHNKAELFVKSKVIELEHRLAHLDRQLDNLERATWPPARDSPRIPPSRLAKYGKMNQEALDAGLTVKKLSQFINAQRTAFRKLLKKYKKWTNQDSLERQFNTLAKDRRSFLQLNLGEPLEKWRELLHKIRGAINRGQSQPMAPSPMIAAKRSSEYISKRLHDAIKSESDVEFDTVFTYSPVGNAGSRAVYWVHPEQLVELQVLLLQYVRSTLGATSEPGSRSSGKSRVGSIGGTDIPPDHGFVVVDDAEAFAQKQNSVSISDSEGAYSHPDIQPAATLTWSKHNREAKFCIADRFIPDTEEGFKTTTQIEKKQFGKLLDVAKPFHPSYENLNEDEIPIPTNVETARGWLSDHPHAKPILAVMSKRCRFSAFPTSRTHGTWMNLDSSIWMCKVEKDEFKDKDWPSVIEGNESLVKFPFAVLEVRQEGKNEVDLIKLLDESHLTERTRGFSLAVHALWASRRPSNMLPPFWLPVLDTDIRKLPAERPRAPRTPRSPSKPFAQSKAGTETGDGTDLTDDPYGSTTAVSVGGDSIAMWLDGTNSPRSKRMAKKKAQIAAQEAEPVKYWNEYDNPEDGAGGEEYFIYVNPGEDVPFTTVFTEMWQNLKGLFYKLKAKHDNDNPGEFDPLLPTSTNSTSTGDDDDVSTISSTDSEPYYSSHHHVEEPSTFIDALARVTHFDPHSDTWMPSLISSMSFFFSTILSLVLVILNETARSKTRPEIDVVTVLGSFIALTFAVGGFYGLLVVRSWRGVTRWTVALTLMGVVVGLNAFLWIRLFQDLARWESGDSGY